MFTTHEPFLTSIIPIRSLSTNLSVNYFHHHPQIPWYLLLLCNLVDRYIILMSWFAQGEKIALGGFSLVTLTGNWLSLSTKFILLSPTLDAVLPKLIILHIPSYHQVRDEEIISKFLTWCVNDISCIQGFGSSVQEWSLLAFLQFYCLTLGEICRNNFKTSWSKHWHIST